MWSVFRVSHGAGRVWQGGGRGGGCVSGVPVSEICFCGCADGIGQHRVVFVLGLVSLINSLTSGEKNAQLVIQLQATRNNFGLNLVSELGVKS